MSDDAELLRRYAEDRSEDAFAEFVRRKIALVYSAALRRMGGDSHAAADVTQGVFLSAARNAKMLARHATLTGWLYTATRNAALNLMRGEERRRSREHTVHIMSELVGAAEAQPNWDSLPALLDEAMDQLGENDREAVLLRFFERRPFAEIGGRLQINENAARMRVERALNRLRALLERRGITSTSAALAVALGEQAMASVPIGLAASVTSTALAGATASIAGSTLATVLTLMSTTKIIVPIAIVLGIAGFGSAVYQRSNAQFAESALAMARRDGAALHARLTQMENQVRALAQEAQLANENLASAKTTLATARAAPAVAGIPRNVSSGIAGPAATPALNSEDILSASPELLQLRTQWYRSSLGLKYGPIYRTLGLSSEQIAAIENVMTRQYQENMEARAAAVSQGVSPSDPLLAPLTKPIGSTVGKDLTEILGPSGAKEFSSAIKAHTGRVAVVDPLAGNLYYTDAPLTPAQADRLTQIIAANTGSLKQSGLVYSPAETNWDVVMAQAQSVLTPAQLATFRAMREKEALQKQLNDLTAALLRDARAKTTRAGNLSPKG